MKGNAVAGVRGHLTRTHSAPHPTRDWRGHARGPGLSWDTPHSMSQPQEWMILPAPVPASGDMYGGRHPCLGPTCVVSAEHRADSVGDVLHWQSRGSGTCDSTSPFTPLCVLPDFVLALTSVCSLDPMLPPGAPATAAPGGAASAGQTGGRRRPAAHTGAPLLHGCGS